MDQVALLALHKTSIEGTGDSARHPHLLVLFSPLALLLVFFFSVLLFLNVYYFGC